MASCKYCGKEIFWMKEGRKNIPCEMDGGKHTCEEGRKARKVSSISVSSLSPEEIAQYEDAINKKK